MTKIIGIPGWSLGEQSFGVSKPYVEYLKQYGQTVILSPNSFIPVDLLVLPGGKDVMGGGHGDFSFWNSDHERFLEHFDNYTLPRYIDNGTPIFGICRGFQTLMRHFGVKITQNIDWDHGYSKDESDTNEHNLLLSDTYKTGYKGYSPPKACGSWHHQCVLETDLDKSQWELVGCTNDGTLKDPFYVVEYVKHTSLPIAATQSHPERNWNSLEKRLILELLYPPLLG